MTKEFNELLQERITNEKKQKKITTITAILFCFFALIIIGLAIHSIEQRKIIETQKKELELVNSKLKQDTLTLNRTADIYEKQAGNVINELKEIEKTNKSIASDTSNTIKYSNKVSIKNSYTNKSYTIYIQYKENFSQQSSMLKAAFSEEYRIAKEQNMKELNFPSSVRYFYKIDKERASQIAKKAEEVLNKKFKVQYMKLKSPENQLEIWIGR